MAIKQAVELQAAENTEGFYVKAGCASAWVSFTSTNRASYVIPSKVPNTHAYLYQIYGKMILFMVSTTIHRHQGE